MNLLKAAKAALIRLDRLDDAGTGKHSPAYLSLKKAIEASGAASDSLDWWTKHRGEASSEPWRMCPDCKVERTDYEGEPDKYLEKCPNCGSKAAPVIGAASSEPKTAREHHSNVVKYLEHEAAASSEPLCNPEFFERMERELRENQRKGDWRIWRPTIHEIMDELDYHYKKLREAVDNQTHIEEACADMANLCMKLYEH